MKRNSKIQIPIYAKAYLTVDEAAAYFNIGKDTMRKISDDPDCKFVLFVGEKRLIKRKILEEYLEGTYSI